MSDWGTQVTARIAEQIRTYRGDRSGQWLADRTKELGHPVSKTTLWGIEQGQRKSISVADLLVIARALEVPPAVLVFPGMPDGQVEALPGWTPAAVIASAWFSGSRLPQRVEPRGEEAVVEYERLAQGARLPNLSSDLGTARSAWLDAQDNALDEASTANTERTQQLADWLVRTAGLVQHLEVEAESLGGTVTDGWTRGEGYEI